jgi:subtilisin family serine protease
MAPDAKWIAVKIFNDRGQATTTGIHQGFQWLLDPDGDPSTPDAPNVVNNSWTMSTASCALDFQLDLRAAAGMLPVFAAGNYGPTPGTVASPANLPEAFAVGGSDNADAIYAYSSRGPSSCAGATAPALTAPAVDVRTSDLYGGYVTETGTSMAAPHVSGALALLLGQIPGLTADLGAPGVGRLGDLQPGCSLGQWHVDFGDYDRRDCGARQLPTHDHRHERHDDAHRDRHARRAGTAGLHRRRRAASANR